MKLPAFAALAILTTSALAVAATATYTPPPQPGTVYVVVAYKFGLKLDKTTVAAKWGGWSKQETFTPPGLAGTCMLNLAAGVVIKMSHAKADSIPLTVSTDGTIVTGPFQGSPPSQWTNNCFRQVSW